ncbi:MAG TPA: xanthine dehydrogenase family protein subunit M [Gemmatimonadales bacterium]|nr:xanthine dehydrogenase family protein subunit M [Gemmatimonadales bacterium]
MVPFAYAAAHDVDAAVTHAARTRGAEFIAGGTDMLQLLEERVRAPAELIDISRLPLADIDVGPAGARIGALARMADVADDPGMQELFPVVVQALVASASPQVRNMATIGGNLLQRTRCLYFRDVATPCNKREPGSGCPAQDGQNRMNAILGGSPHCIAAYAGDLAVALVALDADVLVTGEQGERTIPVGELHRMPGDTPEVETILAPGDLITGIFIPASAFAAQSHYLKLRDRASFEFALTSAAVGLDTDGDTIRQARVAVGGVGTKPWRLPQVEERLVGSRAHADVFHAAAERAADGAEPRAGNAFKVELLRRTVERALRTVAGIP